MAFTYSGDPTESVIDMLRFTVGDTDPSAPILQDAEYEYIIGLYEDQNKQIAAIYRACANHFAVRNVKRTLGPQSEDPRARAAYYSALADKYEGMTVFTSPPPVPNYAADKIFYKGMMSNED